MPNNLQVIPHVDSVSWRPANGWTRREVLRLCLTAGMAAGLAFTDVFGRVSALALNKTPSTTASSSTCHKPANANGTKCCTCGSYVSGANCNSEGWHRHHGVFYTCITYSYILRYTSCGGKNSWKWLTSVWGGSTNWRCSDGKRKYWTCNGYVSGWLKTVCPDVI